MGIYNATPPSLGDGQQTEAQFDSSGNLKVNVAAGGSGGGAVTIADGADVTQGAKADAAWSGSGSGSLVAIFKAICAALTGTVAVAQTRVLTANFSRPADATPYTLGDLVANSTTPGSVVPLSFSMNRVSLQGGMIRRARLRKNGTSITNASFRIHFYTASPTASNGDNGVFLTDQAASYVGKIDVTMDQAFTDGASGNGVPAVGGEINYRADTYYAMLEARAGYTPTSGETFTLELEVVQN